MQDQYFGDIGDFAKYGLLRHLSSANIPLGIQWYRTPNGAGNLNDGKHTTYLTTDRYGEFYRHLDPVLFDFLREKVHRGHRAVRHLEGSSLLLAQFCSAPLDFYTRNTTPADRRAERKRWHSNALAATSSAKLVFLDPDNGLEASASKGSKWALKYAYFDELDDYYSRGQSLLVYHHLGRNGTHAEQVKYQRARLQDRLKGCAVEVFWSRRSSARVFFLVARPEHAVVRSVGEAFLKQTPWTKGAEHIRLFEPK